jgi:hypothetical protein
MTTNEALESSFNLKLIVILTLSVTIVGVLNEKHLVEQDCVLLKGNNVTSTRFRFWFIFITDLFNQGCSDYSW